MCTPITRNLVLILAVFHCFSFFRRERDFGAYTHILHAGGKAMRTDNAADCTMHRVNVEKGHRFAAKDVEGAKKRAAEKRAKRKTKVEEDRELGFQILALADARLVKEKKKKEGGEKVPQAKRRRKEESGEVEMDAVQIQRGDDGKVVGYAGVAKVDGEMVRLLDACKQVEGRKQRAAKGVVDVT